MLNRLIQGNHGLMLHSDLFTLMMVTYNFMESQQVDGSNLLDVTVHHDKSNDEVLGIIIDALLEIAAKGVQIYEAVPGDDIHRIKEIPIVSDFVNFEDTDR